MRLTSWAWTVPLAGAAAVGLLLSLPADEQVASAGASKPAFAPPVKLRGANTFSERQTEPRVAIAQDRRWIIATHGKTGSRFAFVWESMDGGRTWHRTASRPQGQTTSSYDVDMAALPDGRIIAVELDYAGINFRVSYSDDNGRTWHQSSGATYADTDRPYLAVGSWDPKTHARRVYLLFHNLFSGSLHHNMFVQTSTDGGKSFGPPVGITEPGTQAFADLQCADSGGPSNLFVNPGTGRVYAVWGTRGEGPGGGCESAAKSPEINVVGATKVWVASSPNGSPGTWKASLAVRTNKRQSITGMQLSPGAVDRSGKVYVFYTHSPRPYPDYTGAGLRYRWAPANLGEWSKPITVAPGGGAGNILPHIVAGDRGNLDFAWYQGRRLPSGLTIWQPWMAQTRNGLSPSPRISRVRLSANPTYTGTASKLMGVCGKGPAGPAENGIACDRSADLFGVALDRRCYLTVAWPAEKNRATGNRPGTFVSTQRKGPGLC